MINLCIVLLKYSKTATLVLQMLSLNYKLQTNYKSAYKTVAACIYNIHTSHIISHGQIPSHGMNQESSQHINQTWFEKNLMLPDEVKQAPEGGRQGIGLGRP